MVGFDVISVLNREIDQLVGEFNTNMDRQAFLRKWLADLETEATVLNRAIIGKKRQQKQLIDDYVPEQGPTPPGPDPVTEFRDKSAPSAENRPSHK